MDKKYALLDIDFLYKTHLARTVAGHQRVKVLMQQVLDEIYENKFQLLKNGDLQYIVEKEEIK